jgi:NADH:ubiquinone oxidoreductase subunit F (NADH-binding)/ferredoxin
MDAKAIIDEMKASGLGGRGGANFSTGTKWDFLRTATADPRYLVCNADEGDPGAWVNRILLEGDPQLVIEGMLIASLATTAREGYIYIRYEYPLAVARVQKAIDQAYAKGLLGEDILGTGKDFDLFVVKGAGAYVVGEETGLMSSIDGYRGMPRIKPPFPAQAGLWNKPSNVNNVESYANAPLILCNGAEWWSKIGPAATDPSVKEKGTKMFTFSGQINQYGCFEVPWGMTIRHMLEQYGGGMRPGSVLKGWQPGGPLSGVLPASKVDMTTLLDAYKGEGMFLGSGGIVFFDQNTSILDLCLALVSFCEDESCGRCTTCHGGSQRAVEVMRRISMGGGRDTDIEKLQELIKTLVWSNCLHGQFTMTVVKLSLKYFRAEFEQLIRDKVDPSHSLPGFIEYRVRSQSDPDLEKAVAICPTRAIIQDGHGQWTIDPQLCILCGACKEVAPGAIERRDVRTAVGAAQLASAAAS